MTISCIFSFKDSEGIKCTILVKRLEKAFHNARVLSLFAAKVISNKVSVTKVPRME